MAFGYSNGVIGTEGVLLYRHQSAIFDLQGRSLKTFFLTGDFVTFEWDLNGRLQGISSTNFSESILLSGYDAVGNLLQADFVNGNERYLNSSAYDELNQLIHESTISEYSYRYDSM